jgi:hypothetical protein
MVKGTKPYSEGVGSRFLGGKILQITAENLLLSFLHGYTDRKFDLFGDLTKLIVLLFA